MTLLNISNDKKIALQERTKGMSLAELLLELFKELPEEERTNLIIEQFNARSAMKILEDGYATGCTDFCIVYCALLKILNIPYTYIEVLEKRWLEAPMEEMKVMGHCFVKISSKDTFLVDPQRKIIYADPSFVLQRYVVFGEAQEPHELGLTDFKTNMQKYMDFKEAYKQKRNTVSSEK